MLAFLCPCVCRDKQHLANPVDDRSATQGLCSDEVLCRHAMLQYVLLPALALADKPYQLKRFKAGVPELLALLAAPPAATPGLECACACADKFVCC